ncbi:MAG: histidinol-phosphate transaminase [Pseudomonadota bacterium]
MTQPQPQPGIMEIALYQGGKSSVAGVDKVIKLSSNENPFGPSKAAIAAYQDMAGKLHRYPSDSHDDLRTAIANHLALDANRILVGAGSDEIIAFLCQAFAGPGDEVLYTEHGFLMYKISALAAGATPVVAPEKQRQTDVDAVLAAVTSKTKLIFIANPNNPTATFIPMEEIERLADGIPNETILVLDGAYAEYVDGYDGGAALVDARPNVVMTRTFSKLYGLGGLRVGYGYMPRGIYEAVARIRGPFNVTSAGLAAAEAAIKDQQYAQYCLDENRAWGTYLTEGLRAIGLEVDESFANFVLVRFKTEELAEAANAALARQGLIVRQVSSYNLPECLRITIGTEENCKSVIAVLSEFMEAQNG